MMANIFVPSPTCAGKQHGSYFEATRVMIRVSVGSRALAA